MTSSGSDESLIAGLLALPAAERMPALERACAEDATLRGRMPKIMAALAAADDRPQAVPGGGLSPDRRVLALNLALEADAAETPGARIGPYKLLQEIGRGGFGVVWMAEQEGPIRRRVALKIIKAGMDTKEVIARFEAERQALALMEHPNIARVFDAGATASGRPFFVMELVRGVAITRYCDENRLPVEARLRLIMTVCQAVQHAHQKGVIHRDLKPSNILVTLHDGAPVPKVIDFGIAKATRSQLTEKTLFTQFHAFIGTPAYTSPEQMEMSGLDVDTRSDIYSLGVLLYELLTGRPPFDADALVKSGLEAMRRTIREIDPPRPSNRLTTLTELERTSVGQQRRTEAGKLSLLLRGDLDWIVMRCLEKDRTRRYETANGLARDIERHLENEPVAARPPTSAYRLRKFVRRHKLGFAAATAIAASLVVGLIVSSVLLVRERAAHARAVVAERAESGLRHEAETARELEKMRASRTALVLADQLLEKGQTADALAYLVHAARMDPANTTIAPRLASVLTSRNFLIPEGAPLQCGSRALAVRFSNDGRSIYVGAEDGTFRVFDAASGELGREIHLGKGVMREGWVFADKNDAVFAVCFADQTAGLFEVSTGRPVWPPVHVDLRFPRSAQAWNLSDLQLSPDAHWLCVQGSHAFRVLDAATGEVRAEFTKGHFGPVFTNDGTRLAFVSEDTVHVWSLPEFKPSFEPIPIKGRLISSPGPLPYYSPDGRFLAVVDNWDGAWVFDAANGVLVRREQNAPKFSGSGFRGFSPDGRLFAPTGNSWELLDVTSGKLTSLPVTPGFSGNRTASADGKLLLTASEDGFPRLWETATGRLVAEATVHQRDSFCAALSPDGTRVVLGTDAGAILRLRVGRGAARPLALHRFPHPISGSAPFFNQGPARLLWFQGDHAVALDVASGREVAGGFAYPPSDLLALQGSATWIHSRADFKFFVICDWTGQFPSFAWELTDAGIRRIGTFQGDQGIHPVGSGLRFSPGGDLVAQASGWGSKRIGVWNLHTGARVGPGCSYKNEHLIYLAPEFSADGKRLACPLSDGRVVIWVVATGQAVTVLKAQSDSTCWMVRFSPDGARLLTLDGRKEARLWNTATGEPSGPIISGAEYGDFSEDGRRYFTAGPTSVRIWDGKTGALVSEFNASGTGDICFSRDGERIVAPDGDGNMRVRDVPTGQPLTEPVRLSPPIWQVCWGPDGHFLQFTVSDGKCHFWPVPPALPAGTPIPPWLLQLASICAMKKIDEAEQCVDASEVVAQIDDVRRQLAALPSDSPYVEWGRWFLDDSPTRSIAPGFTMTPAEAEKLEAELYRSTGS